MSMTDEELEQYRVNAIERNMRAEGVATETLVQHDYFGFSAAHRVILPDGVSYIEHQEMNEGQRRDYLNKSNRDMKIQKATGDAIVRMKPGDDRHELLTIAVIGWNLVSGGQPVPFSKGTFTKWLSAADPRLVDLVEKDIRKCNPWLLANMTVEDIDKEIANLQEMREVAVRNEEGKES